VQDHRVASNQLLAFETVDDEAGGFCKVQLGELRCDRIEAINRAAVVILVWLTISFSDIPLIRAGSHASSFIA
jgi:hypothetical protein